jgi:hypothetical protein
MFSPMGHISAKNVYDDFRSASLEVWPNPFAASELATATVSQKDTWNVISWNRYADTSREFLAFLAATPTLSICSPNGVSLRVHKQILSRELNETGIGFSGMWMINHRNWMVDSSRAEKWLQRSQEMAEELKQTIKFKKKASQNIEKLQAQLENRTFGMRIASDLILAFRAFDQSSLVLAEADVPDKKEIKKLLAVHTEPQPQIESQGGRPSKQEAVLEAYRATFPYGNERTSWKRTMQKIEEETGTTGGIDTLKRALGLRK